MGETAAESGFARWKSTNGSGAPSSTADAALLPDGGAATGGLGGVVEALAGVGAGAADCARAPWDRSKSRARGVRSTSGLMASSLEFHGGFHATVGFSARVRCVVHGGQRSALSFDGEQGPGHPLPHQTVGYGLRAVIG